MSMPASICFSTTAPTAERMRAFRPAGSTGTPSSLANIARTRSSGRGRLPVCVVKKRSVLRFIEEGAYGPSPPFRGEGESSRDPSSGSASLQARHDVLAQQLQRARHRLVRNQGAKIELRKNAVQPE